MSEWLVPWTDDGIPHFVPVGAARYQGTEVRWEDRAPFWAWLQWKGMQRGRSALYFVWADGGETYSMFATDLDDMVRKYGVTEYATGWWLPVKRGQNYGVRFVGSDPISR